MKKLFKSKTLLASVAAIAICASLIAGATFAIFTSKAEVNIAVSSGSVSVTATVDTDSIATKQLYDAEYQSGTGHVSPDATVEFADGTLSLSNVIAGDGVKFNIVVKNESTVGVKFRTLVMCDEDNGLFAGLQVSVNGVTFDGTTAVSAYTAVEPGSDDVIVPVEIELPESAEGTLGGKKCVVVYRIEAVQGNAKTEDPETGDVYIANASDMAAFRDKVNAGDTYAGKTVRLMNDIDFNGANWTPVGVDTRFMGTFDGMNHSIKNATIVYGKPSGSSYYGGGFFSNISGATIKNVTFEGFTVNSGKVREGTENIYIGNIYGVACGYAYGNSTFEKVTVKNSHVEGYGKIGAILGYAASSGVTYTFTDCSVENTEVVGVYNLGGLFGTMGVSTLKVNNCDVEGASFMRASTEYTVPTPFFTKNVKRNLLGREMTFAAGEAENYFCVYSAKLGTMLRADDGKLGSEIAYDSVDQIATVYKTLEQASGIKTGYGETNTVTEFDGKNTVIINDWTDAWVNKELTIKNVMFGNGAVFNVNADGVTLNLEGCTFIACDPEKITVSHKTNSGWGMCLDLEIGAKRKEGNVNYHYDNVTFNVKNCISLGESNASLDRDGVQYNGSALTGQKKSRGHGIALNAIAGGLNADGVKLNIEGCEITGVRGNAIQLYGESGDIVIKDTKINSWGMNNYTAKDDAAIRGDYVVGGKRTLTLTNVYFGLDENNDVANGKLIYHVNVGKYEGNTSTTRTAGTY